MLLFVIEYIFVFLIGSILGWCLEVVYRRYFGLAKKWINPGFLAGPFLPLYGSAVMILYAVSNIEMILVIRLSIFAIITTTLEYITGLFFLKVYNTRLWDYSDMKFNIQGIIHPLYTVFWTMLSTLFFYVLYPFFSLRVDYIYNHLELSLLIGVTLGFVILDCIQSFDVLNRLKKFAKEAGEKTPAIQYELLKMEIKDRFRDMPVKIRFLKPFSGDFNLKDEVRLHIENIKAESKSHIKIPEHLRRH